MTGDGDRAHVAHSAQAMIVAGSACELDDLERPAEVDVETRLLTSTVERSGAVDDRVGSLHQLPIAICLESEVRFGQVTEKDVAPLPKEFIEAWKCEMELQRLPQARFSAFHILGAYQQIKRLGGALEQVGCNMRSKISTGSGQKDRHGSYMECGDLSP